MKEHLTLLNTISGPKGFIDIDDFYSVTVSKYEVSLQGKVTSEAMQKHSHRFSLCVEDNGYITGRALVDGVSIRITLT
jgi:hypothetical protein